ncbi:DegT/DnrJ/EryC1/StrS family aminotransferase, partial [Calditrichota bacterium]
NYQTYSIYLESSNRNRIIGLMSEQGIEVQIGTYALHRQPVFADLRKCGDLANSAALADHLLALPLHAQLTKDDQIRVVETLVHLL